MRYSILIGGIIFACLWHLSCNENSDTGPVIQAADTGIGYTDSINRRVPQYQYVEVVPRDIKVKHYFTYMDSIVLLYDSLVEYPLTEHILVRANPWIVDSLVSFDYYKKMEQGIFIYDQKEMIALHKGDSLFIPDIRRAAGIAIALSATVIDVNIPEYKLRIIEHDTVKYVFDVRVGKNQYKYLKAARRKVDLRTPIGSGEIVRIEKDPWYINPVNNRRYFSTQRDDGKYTRLPRIPFLEPMISNLRQGALIHPTTNPNTLGQARSNGCVGTGEGDAWQVYYHAPLGTKVIYRYDPEIVNESGDTIKLEDIYHLKKSENKTDSLQVDS